MGLNLSEGGAVFRVRSQGLQQEVLSQDGCRILLQAVKVFNGGKVPMDIY
jgi:hypothetical protein